MIQLKESFNLNFRSYLKRLLGLRLPAALLLMIFCLFRRLALPWDPARLKAECAPGRIREALTILIGYEQLAKR